MSAFKKKLIFVLGMHRSGTSALTGVLSKLGAGLPRALMDVHETNPKGFFESTEIMRVNNEILAAHGSSWHDFRPLAVEATETFKAQIARVLDSEYAGSDFVVLKDPRICRMVPIWESAATEIGYETHYIISYRHPLEVAKSLNKRDATSIAEGVILWLRHVLEAEYATRNKNRAFVSMGSLLDDWQMAVRNIANRAKIEWPCTPDSMTNEIDAFLDSNLRHQRSTGNEPDLITLMGGWVSDVFSYVQMLEKHEVEIPGLDRVRRELDTACRLFGPALHQRLEQTVAAERAHREKDKALAGLRTNADLLRSEHVTMTGILQVVQREKKEVLVDLADLSARAGRLEAERDAALASKHQMEAKLEEQSLRLSRLSQQIKLGETEGRLKTTPPHLERAEALLQTEQPLKETDLFIAPQAHRPLETAAYDRLSFEVSRIEFACEAYLQLTQESQFESQRTIEELESQIRKLKQIVDETKMAWRNETDTLNTQLLKTRERFDAQNLLLARFTGAARVHFLTWAFSKALRPS